MIVWIRSLIVWSSQTVDLRLFGGDLKDKKEQDGRNDSFMCGSEKIHEAPSAVPAGLGCSLAVLAVWWLNLLSNGPGCDGLDDVSN